MLFDLYELRKYTVLNSPKYSLIHFFLGGAREIFEVSVSFTGLEFGAEVDGAYNWGAVIFTPFTGNAYPLKPWGSCLNVFSVTGIGSMTLPNSVSRVFKAIVFRVSV